MQTSSRSLRPGTLLPLLLVACGPEPVELPPTGVYRFEDTRLENTCEPFNAPTWGSEEVVEVKDDAILVPAAYHLSPPTDCEQCVPLSEWVQHVARPDPDGAGYVAQTEWKQEGECSRRETVAVEVTDETGLRARITSEWRGSAGCAWKSPEGKGCKVVREYTYTLLEACDCVFPIAKNPPP